MKIEEIKNDEDFKQKALDFISLFEGFKPKAYYDSEGIPHIGYGVAQIKQSKISQK